MLAPIASADNSTVDQWQDPWVTISGDLHSIVRDADHRAYKVESLMAKPSTRNELGAIGTSWSESFCNRADSGISERCTDRGP
jgi:hypothetical protein